MRGILFGIPTLFLVALAAALPGTARAEAYARTSVTFDGLRAGQVVSSVRSGAGFSGTAIPGEISVFGASANPKVTGNAALVFDAACGGGGPAACSGGESDLHQPELGNVLVIANSLRDADGDGLVDVPDVHNGGGKFTFNFAGFGPGSVRIEAVDVLDIEKPRETGTIQLFSGAALIATIPLPDTKDNGKATVPISVAGVDRMEVTLSGSGALDNLRVSVGTPPPPPRRATCASLRLRAKPLSVKRRTLVSVTVRTTTGAAMRNTRVRVRGAGVNLQRRTGARGVARFFVRPTRVGVVRFSVPGSIRCAGRLAVGTQRIRPALAG